MPETFFRTSSSLDGPRTRRGCRRLIISQELLTDFLTGVPCGVKVNGLPADAEVVGLGHDILCNAVVAYIASETFEQGEPGYELPTLGLEYRASHGQIVEVIVHV